MSVKQDLIPVKHIRTGYKLTRCLGLVIRWISVCQSGAGFKGLIRKGGILCLALVAMWLDKLLGASYVRVAVCLFFIANEGLSILENLGLMGVPMPPFLKSMLEAMKDKSGSGKSNKVSKA